MKDKKDWRERERKRKDNNLNRNNHNHNHNHNQHIKKSKNNSFKLLQYHMIYVSYPSPPSSIFFIFLSSSSHHYFSSELYCTGYCTVRMILYPVRYGTQVPGYHPTVQTRSVIISHWVILDQVMRSPTGSSSQGSGVKIKLATVLLDVGL